MIESAPDLFGYVAPLPSMKRRREAIPSGYAGTLGKGPNGETCRTCAHNTRRAGVAGNYHKCDLMRADWTGGRKTDIKTSSPACEKWGTK